MKITCNESTFKRALLRNHAKDVIFVSPEHFYYRTKKALWYCDLKSNIERAFFTMWCDLSHIEVKPFGASEVF